MASTSPMSVRETTSASNTHGGLGLLYNLRRTQQSKSNTINLTQDLYICGGRRSVLHPSPAVSKCLSTLSFPLPTLPKSVIAIFFHNKVYEVFKNDKC